MKTTKTKDLRSSTMRFLIDNKAMLLALLALIAASVISPTFFSFQNLRNVIRQNTTYFVLAFGFTCVLSSGNIDLSVGLMTGMLGIFVGILLIQIVLIQIVFIRRERFIVQVRPIRLAECIV